MIEYILAGVAVLTLVGTIIGVWTSLNEKNKTNEMNIKQLQKDVEEAKENNKIIHVTISNLNNSIHELNIKQTETNTLLKILVEERKMKND